MKKLVLLGLVSLSLFANNVVYFNKAMKYINDKDYKQAMNYFKKSCNLGYAQGCGAVGELYFKGIGVGRDYKEALKYFKKSCDLGNAKGCVMAGLFYFNGNGVGRDYKEALKYFKKSCDLGYAQGCGAVGEFYFKGNGVGIDYKTASKYYKKSCDMGLKEACKDYKTAKQQYKLINALLQLSDKESESASKKVNEGINYLYKGATAEIDGNIKQALKYYKKACDLGVKGGCNSYKRLKNKK